ncbi:hypothetical protein [Alloyangia pacifica]|uniref:hypothetical protein n=1 Tax=Alloyangia pacifica TaxID=311180 RepID=UPI001CD764AF|nr:hypothetical protein [Alloyangia pacifica]MCA0994270.1 hypothetical protein [Alloyangia pacifica]
MSNGAGLLRRASADILSLPDSFVRAIFAITIAHQMALAIAALYFGSMNFADGAFFSFIIAANEPWTLHWSDFSARLTAYLMTAAPTHLIADIFDLSGPVISKFYGFFFYMLICMQHVLIARLAWRNNTRYLILPVASYLFGTGLSFGFPSELQLGIGFFWLTVFLLLSGHRLLIALSVPSAFLMLFSHEVGAFGLLIISALTLRLPSLPRVERLALLLCQASLLGILVWLKFSGLSSGANGNAIFILDPRRIVKNPSLWALGLAMLAAMAVYRVSPLRMSANLLIATCIGLLIPLLMAQHFNFLIGRYGSARSLMALMMLIAPLPLMLWLPPAAVPRSPAVSTSLIATVLAAALGASIGSNLSQIREWQADYAVASAYFNSGHPEAGTPDLVNLSALEADAPEVQRALTRLGLGTSWTWPFLAFMSTPDYRPSRMVVNDRLGNSMCDFSALLPQDASPIPKEHLNKIRAHICALDKPARHIGLIERLKRKLG